MGMQAQDSECLHGETYVVWGGGIVIDTARKVLGKVLELTNLHPVGYRLAKKGLVRIEDGEGGRDSCLGSRDRDPLLKGCALLGAPRDAMAT